MVAFDLLVQGKKDEVSNKSSNTGVTPAYCKPDPRNTQIPVQD